MPRPWTAKDAVFMSHRAASTPSPDPWNVPPALGRWIWVILAVSAILMAIFLGVLGWALTMPARLLGEARRASEAGDWETAARAWHRYNREGAAGPETLRDECRAWLAAGHPAEADRAAGRAILSEPGQPEPWLVRLEILRVEDRSIEAQTVAWQAVEVVPEAVRRRILRALTLAVLADVPEDLARERLTRWSEADPSDLDARVALLVRIAAHPRPEDPDRQARLAELGAILERRPDHGAAREAYVQGCAEAGDPDRGRGMLDTWPESKRDARYHRLRGRWNLEYDHQFDKAVSDLSRALIDVPNDWRTQYRLARALRNAGRVAEAQAAARGVEKLREVLEPDALGKRLEADFQTLDRPKSRRDLADLCDQVGLERLAGAWRLDVAADPTPRRATAPAGPAEP